MKIIDIEKLVFDDMKNYHQPIFEYSNFFDIDVGILASVIYVEKVQYELPNILSKLRMYKNGLCQQRVFNAILYKWLKRTAGYTHVMGNMVFCTEKKFREMNSKYAGVLTEKDQELLPFNVDVSIKVSAAILRCIYEFWLPEIDVKHDPAILGTLYNINFRYEKPLPHKNPVPGGSDMDLIIDGKHYQNGIDYLHLNFGTRTKLVYNSQSMANFLRGYHEAINNFNSTDQVVKAYFYPAKI